MNYTIKQLTLLACMIILFSGCTSENRVEAEMNQKSEAKRVVHRAIGAGRWFPADKATLKKMVEDYIRNAEAKDIHGRIIGALVPHAGYIYCGRVAGYVYRAVQDQVQKGIVPETVVILGIPHRGRFHGIALMDGDAIETPLGEAPLDKEAGAFLANHSRLIQFNYAPHNGEHSAENQVPFVQTVLPDAKLIIGIIGDHDTQTMNDLVEALDKLAQQKKILVLASSDMLHDPDYELVTKTDQASLKLVAAMKTRRILDEWNYQHQTFCGVAALAVTMQFAENQSCTQGTVLFYRNNGDDFPESRGQWVVGYGAVVFTIQAK